MMGFISPKELRALGMLGINQRNSDYVMRYNPRHLYPLVDDKLRTKSLAISAGIDVPKLYATLEINNQISSLDTLLEQHQEVVIKPAHGSGGNGILVLGGRIGKFYRTANGDLITLNSIKHYVSNILSGMYSLGGISDTAFLEYRVKFDRVFDNVSFKGVPDIRIIVFQGIPVAAMLRLPTSKSGGKANLHQGAIGVGVNLASGKTTSSIIGNIITTTHPDTGHSINDLQIPQWDKILHIAINCADTVGLGYLGVDLVLDSELGPLMLELNARPGLNVQLANQRGLLHNLHKVEQLEKIPKSIDDRISISKTLLLN
jgi:alpha-L-glutamate ligase-like protein